MASVKVEGDSLVLTLSAVEKVGALHGDITVPRAAVLNVRPTSAPLREVRGLRSPGTGVPWFVALGTYRTLQSRDFCAAYRAPGVVVELKGQRYDRLVVSTPDIERILAAFVA